MGLFSGVFDSIGDIFEGSVDFFGDIATGDFGGAVGGLVETTGDVLEEFGLQQYAAELGAGLGAVFGGPLGSSLGSVLGGIIEGPQARPLSAAAAPRTFFPAVPYPTGGSIVNFDDYGGGDGGNGGGMIQTGLPLAAAGIWLGSLLARSFGRGAASAIFTAANGVRVRINQLWPLVRQYGPTAVSGALGIGVGSLGALLAQAPTGGTKRRRRGISARDVTTTRRTLKTIRRFYGMMPTRRPSSGGYRHSHRHGHR